MTFSHQPNVSSHHQAHGTTNHSASTIAPIQNDCNMSNNYREESHSSSGILKAALSAVYQKNRNGTTCASTSATESTLQSRITNRTNTSPFQHLIQQEYQPFDKIHVINRDRPIVYHAGHEEEFEEYNFTYSQFMIAGGIAGFFEHTAMYPVDTVKTRMQAITNNSPHYRGTFNALKTIFETERFGIYRGVSAVAIGAIPSHALYFCTYEYVQQFFQPIFEPGLRQKHIERYKHDEEHHNDKLPPHAIATGLSGIMATMVHDGVSTPLDVVKQRMQLYNSSYKSVTHCISEIYKREGLSAFFRSYPTTLLMNIPYTMVHFYVYESVKHTMSEQDNHAYHHYNHVVAGGIAGALAAAVSTPVDVIKTRLQTQGDVILYHGIMDTSRSIFKNEGWAGFFKGTVPRMMYFAPSAAITWCVYEYIKKILGV